LRLKYDRESVKKIVKKMRCVGTTDKYKRGRVLRRPEEKELKFARAGLENTEFLHFLKLKFSDW
jgi:hypothetical protein